MTASAASAITTAFHGAAASVAASVVPVAHAAQLASNASNLTNAKYGYDFVVATTQASINGTMLEFLSSRQEPIATVCYVADRTGKPVPIDYEQLKQNAHGSDPFAVPNDADPATNADVKNLLGARFMMGFRAELGIPHVADPTTLPDVVVLGSNTSSVNFNMLCSQFNIVQLDPGSVWSSPSWLNLSQPADAPWVFTSKVDLRLSTVDGSAYSKLPADIQAKIKNLGGSAFSVQQLLFDLSNAALMTVPTISGITPGTQLYMLLQQYFLGAYFVQMQKESQPLLGCSIVMHTAPVSTLSLTNFNFEVNPYVDANGQPIAKPTSDQQQLTTLNYLCAADGHALPPAVQFNWNWVDASQVNDHDGVIAINRNTFANYFRTQLAPYVPKNCILPSARVWLSGFAGSTTNYSWGLHPGQAPTVTTPATGSTVLKFAYSSTASDSAGLNGDMGALRLTPSFTLTVDFVGDTVVVTQHLVVYIDVRRYQTSGSGNLVDKTIVDTYTIGISAAGSLVSSPPKSVLTDHSDSPTVNAALNFFTNFNDIANDVKNNIQAFASSRLTDMPISTIQNYVFPGGKTFVFKSVGFSAYQDLVSYISYADPTAPMPMVAPTAHSLSNMIVKN